MGYRTGTQFDGRADGIGQPLEDLRISVSVLHFGLRAGIRRVPCTEELGRPILKSSTKPGYQHLLQRIIVFKLLGEPSGGNLCRIVHQVGR